MGVVVLDIPGFRDCYPEFSNVTDGQLALLFESATDYLDNTHFSLVIDLAKRQRFLYLLMAHLAYMRYGDKDGNGKSGAVGRVSSASEGSVSVSLDAGGVAFRYMWYTQSPYGMDYWQATKVYRMANYYPGG
ncbi:DUF4054 domain-containing protein [Serratia marcescens]|uniref:DUF4054 domain-containing protein n=1 Tax=Serratia marcescens TaxID=615 RepID=UPI00124A40DE|nr:DUF4054 domain-containing protein [Serratia marcescens]KAB1581154.1 DUF4054 domain-containing protein [Serratia marcescens]